MEKRYLNWKPMKLKYKFHNCYFGLHVIWGGFVEYGWITEESGLDFSTAFSRYLAISLLFIAPTVGVGRLDEERNAGLCSWPQLCNTSPFHGAELNKKGNLPISASFILTTYKICIMTVSHRNAVSEFIVVFYRLRSHNLAIIIKYKTAFTSL